MSSASDDRGTAAIDRCVSQIRSADTREAERVAAACVRGLQAADVRALAERWDHVPDGTVRLLLVLGIHTQGSRHGQDAVRVLDAAARYADGRVAEAAAEALGAQAGSGIFERLTALLDRDGPAQVGAIRGLAILGERRAVAALRTTLDGPDRQIPAATPSPDAGPITLHDEVRMALRRLTPAHNV